MPMRENGIRLLQLKFIRTEIHLYKVKNDLYVFVWRDSGSDIE